MKERWPHNDLQNKLQNSNFKPIQHCSMEQTTTNSDCLPTRKGRREDEREQRKKTQTKQKTVQRYVSVAPELDLVFLMQWIPSSESGNVALCISPGLWSWDVACMSQKVYLQGQMSNGLRNTKVFLESPFKQKVEMSLKLTTFPLLPGSSLAQAGLWLGWHRPQT